jgi:arylsulfatase A
MLMTIDLFPTIAKLAGAKLPKLPIDGLDVWPLLSGAPGAANPHEAYLFYFAQNELQAVASGDGHWKLQLPHTYNSLAGRPAGKNGPPAKYELRVIQTPELYNLVNDIGETTDVAARHLDVVAHLLSIADRARDDLGDALTKRQGRGMRPAGKLDESAGQR